jgi:hypothetical protein
MTRKRILFGLFGSTEELEEMKKGKKVEPVI